MNNKIKWVKGKPLCPHCGSELTSWNENVGYALINWHYEKGLIVEDIKDTSDIIFQCPYCDEELDDLDELMVYLEERSKGGVKW